MTQNNEGIPTQPSRELAMRAQDVPYFNNKAELIEFIDKLTTMDHDYGTCVYAMSMAAVATFNYMASQLGVTGFQASCADLDIIRRTRRINSPFMLIKLEDALWPQYDVPGKVGEFLNSDDSREWLRAQAQAKLDENHEMVAGSVRDHWQRLAAHPPKNGG